eukprot:TRINITY_DN40549_c0_g2_i1.p1 TRINITY_DN40549_c0_g2~~TRINITY_DN40549_c0_g2_i1.p1  ORF type:complete len:105 (+),score=9.94 TRINITY_DN40549_c0_g2_i1:63-377(+)
MALEFERKRFGFYKMSEGSLEIKGEFLHYNRKDYQCIFFPVDEEVLRIKLDTISSWHMSRPIQLGCYKLNTNFLHIYSDNFKIVLPVSSSIKEDVESMLEEIGN